MHIVLNNSKKKIMLKQTLFIGNRDKDNKKNVDTPPTKVVPYGKLYFQKNH